MQNKKKSRRTRLLIAIGILALLIGLDIIGLNPLSERGSLVGEGTGTEGGCGGYEGDFEQTVSLAIPAIGRSEESLFIKRSKIWDSPIIPVCWENPSDDDEEERGWMEDAITETWEAVSALEFSGWDACEKDSAGIRIRIKDSGPRAKKLGKAIAGVKDGMIVNFEFETWSRGCRSRREYCIGVIGVHEFGHALGFVHEQNRADSRCDGKEQGSYGDFVIGPWDLQSVMNYCNPRWSGGGKLSAIDIMGVQQIYGKSEDALQDVFELCDQETSQGWQGTCENSSSFDDYFKGRCRCQGDLLVDDLSGEIVCGSGTPNCTDKSVYDSARQFTPVSPAFRALYGHCDELRARSFWYGSCDSPAVRDPALFKGECVCAGDVYRHKVTGLFVCDKLPDTCGGSSATLLPSWDFEAVPAVLYTNPALAGLYHYCNKLREKGDWLDCTMPAVDDPELFNDLCGCEEPLVRHTASGLYQCPRLQESCGGLEFEPASDEYDLDGSECYVTHNGDDYQGTVSTTEDDEDCISWDDVYGEGIIEELASELSDHNHCRTTGDKRKRAPFCYTDDDPVKWGYCDVGQPSSVCLESSRYPCAPMPCTHGARCVDQGEGNYRCVCRAGSEGDDCSILSDNWCEGVTCGENGACENDIDGYTCRCEKGYRGRHCEVEVTTHKALPLPSEEGFLGCAQTSGPLLPLLGGLLFCGMRRRRRGRVQVRDSSALEGDSEARSSL